MEGNGDFAWLGQGTLVPGEEPDDPENYPVFFVIALGFTFAGSLLSSAVVWELTDTFNGLMAIPNLVALLLLSGVVIAETNKYFKK